MNRRRFLALTAAAASLAGQAGARTVWQGRAFGADCRLDLQGPEDSAALVLNGLPKLIESIEAEFSLHRDSSLTRLNSTGSLTDPSPAFRALVALSDAVHRLTDGAFDPSVQPLWQALATGQSPTGPVGWHLVGQGAAITLRPGMGLTFNGIAQGFAADAVRALLSHHGFGQAFIDMGEIATLGGPFTVGLQDPMAGQLATRRLQGTAIATSSPWATLVGGQPHIQHPRGLPPLWSSVTVEARSAALADALSTALCFLPRARIAALRHPGLVRVTLVDREGNLESLQP